MSVLEALTANQQKLVLTSAVFILYFVVIVAFAVVYFRYFIANPSSFSFAASISESQRVNRLAELEQSNRRLGNIGDVLSAVGTKLEGHLDTVLYPGEWKMETDQGSLQYLNVANSNPHAPSVSACMVVFTKDVEDFQSHHRWISGNRLFRQSSTTTSKLQSEIARERRFLASRRENALQLEKSFKAGSPMIWTFTDFLYFSTIIQSTVGLGDIQPNSTKVRAVVILQIMIGYLILIVILNIILGWQWVIK
jgi:Ion channel